MWKKTGALFLALLMLLPAGCRKNEGGTGKSEVPYKIGIVTGGAVYNEAVFAAERQAAAKDYIVTRTFPDDMSAEKTVSICTELAADPAMRAIVFVRAVAGIDEAARKVKEARPDILFIVGADTEDAGFAAQTADIVFTQDFYAMGREVANEAYRMGAKS